MLRIDASAGAQYNALMVRQIPAVTGDPRVAHAAFNGSSFEISLQNLDTTKTYQLRRSTNLATFSDIGLPFTPVSAARVVSDPSPPQGRAFYRIVETEP